MPLRVLIVDDHTLVRDGLRAVLEAVESIAVAGDAPDGEQAVALALQLQPDAVIMDIQMPGMDGIQATRQIKEAAPRTCVIILSITGSAEQVFAALQAGARGYLLKESAGREVIDAVLACRNGNYYLSQPVTNLLVADYLQHRLPFTQPCAAIDCLSPREREILPLVAAGWSSVEIGKFLFLSPKTVDTYRSRMMRKLGVDDLTGLVRLAVQAGLVN